MSRSAMLSAVVVLGLALASGLGGCSTAPKEAKKPQLEQDARSSTAWFESKVSGLSSQLDNSAGFVIFPDVLQYGTLIGGGTWGRGILADSDGKQIGWASVNAGTIGLQAGVQGLKIMMVIQDEATMAKFKENKLSGSASGMLVGGDGVGAAGNFDHGIVMYQGARTGLMAGVRIGLNYVRYEALTAADKPGDMR